MVDVLLFTEAEIPIGKMSDNQSGVRLPDGRLCTTRYVPIQNKLSNHLLH